MNMAFERKNIGVEAAERKIKHYCGYQERSHAEVKEKLYSFGLRKGEVEQLISQMIEENWMPKDTTIDYNDDTVFDVPLHRYYKAKQ